MATERALVFDCKGDELPAIVHVPDGEADTGILVVVGGPQYRVGSHRQFVLLARHLAEQGVAAFRFDYRGMGDAAGTPRSFLSVDDDIAAALDTFCLQVPSLKKIYVWGLCDAASAALFYAHQDARISGLVLANPWARSEAGQAKAYLKHYYLRQLLSGSFWRRLLSGQLNVIDSASSLLQQLLQARGNTKHESGEMPDSAVSAEEDGQYIDRMLAGLKKFSGRILVLISKDDLTAAEFVDLVNSSREWKKTLSDKRVGWREIPEANHTFSTRIWRDEVARITFEWLRNAH